MTKHVRSVLGVLCLGISVAGCQGIPGLFGPGAGTFDGDPPNGSSGIIANNAASLSGQVFAPSSLVANNSAALVGNNSAALVSNNAAAYRTTSLQELPVIKAQVEAVRGGEVVATATTDDSGKYTLPNLTKEKAYLLRVTFTLDGQKFQELAIAKTLPQQTSHSVNSASTLVTAKVLTKGTTLEQLNMVRYYDTVNLVKAAQGSIERSALMSTEASSAAFDQMSQSNDQVANTFNDAVTPPASSTDPTPDPATTTYAARDYFFPPSATARGEFVTTTTETTGQTTEVSSNSFSVQFSSYTTTAATLERVVGDLTFPSQLSVVGGQVKIDAMTLGAPVFTTEGSTVTPFDAAESVSYALVAANQQVTVKAGTFTCVKLLETTKTGSTVTKQTTQWYAKGLGVGPVKAVTTSSDGTTTTTVETVLKSFTP